MAEAEDSIVSTWAIGAQPSHENCYELNIFYYEKIVQKMEKKSLNRFDQSQFVCDSCIF